MRVLIIEDNVTQAESLGLVLKAAGHVVYLAGDGNQGLSQLDVHVADLAVIDLATPGMDGREFLARLRADPRWEPLPVVISTGLPREATADLEGRPGVWVFEKPWHPAKLLRLLESL